MFLHCLYIDLPDIENQAIRNYCHQWIDSYSHQLLKMAGTDRKLCGEKWISIKASWSPYISDNRFIYNS